MTLNTAGLDIFIAGLPTAIDDGAQETAETVLAKRNPLTPVDTGDLLATGHIEGDTDGQRRVVEGTGLGDARAPYTEYGTHKQSAQPHMTPAAEQTDMSAIVAKHIKALADRSHI